jgi:hypothetical protein
LVTDAPTDRPPVRLAADPARRLLVEIIEAAEGAWGERKLYVPRKKK